MGRRLPLLVLGGAWAPRRGSAFVRCTSTLPHVARPIQQKGARTAAALALTASFGALATSGAAASTEAALKVRVATYNVLSSHLAEPGYFSKCAPENLDPQTRLERVMEQLEAEVAAGSVIALQEVSRDWAGPLQIYFSQRGYEFTTGLYGVAFNGYMGVAMAWPRTYETVEIDQCRLADNLPSAPWSRPPRPEPPSWPKWAALVQRARNMFRAATAPLESPRPAFDTWHEASRKHNVLVSVKLKAPNAQQFVVSCYHMPCLFGSVDKERVMVIHAALAAARTAKVAGGLPHVLAGDFNIKPFDASYRLLTSGALGDEFKAYALPPRPDVLHDFTATCAPLESAYCKKDGKEPDFTNFAFNKFQTETFIETLDYIFCSQGDWKVDAVKALPARASVDLEKPFPDAKQPSDHVMIAASLSLVKK